MDYREYAKETTEYIQQQLEEFQTRYTGSDLELPDAIATLDSIHNQVRDTAITLGLAAITEGGATRRSIAAILEVHPLTISRWLAAREVEQPGS